MRIQILFLLAVFTIGLSCTKVDLYRSYCINQRIKEYKKDHDCDGARISSWHYLGRTVYVFDPGTCAVVSDEPKSLFDKDCQLICYIGGWAATEECEGDKFYNKAIYKVTIWKN